MEKKYPVVTLCGSTRFKEEFIKAQKALTLEGYIVISVGLFGHGGDPEVWDGMDEGTVTKTKEMLDDMHKRKIDMSDEIFVINVGGYIGESTRSEIDYAKQHGKLVRYLEEKKKVLLLEDEPTIREVLKEYMTISGYQVTEAERGDQAVSLLQEEAFDAAVLDIMVPGIDGFEVLRFIREQKPDMAVIMLTALGDEKTQVKAFNLYADDYIIKPVSPIILLKRMETVLRRTAGSVHKSDIEKQDGIYLQQEAYSAYYKGKKLPLTLSEYLLLQTLYEEPNRVFTREQLIMCIFNEDYIGNDRIIDVHVKNLRKKLPAAYIKTVIGVGYQFDKEADL